jgi:NAD(P)-dependent dehydrogenase (short-subunit alcohol dehydrogenase family)
MQFEGKRAVITGAGSGIGRALAIEGSEKGIRLALMGRRREALDQTLSKLTGTGHFVVTGDITKAADRLSLMVAVEKQWGGLDILANNAGVIPFGPLIETTDDQLQAAIDTNLLGPMALVREALPLLRREKGRVVNIGSVLGDIPYPLFAAYSATKAGLRGFSIALRRELAPLGIGVTYAALRATRTPASDPLQALIEPFDMKLDAPEAVAKFVWNAVARDANSVYPKGPERLFVLLQHLLPNVVDKSIAKQLSKVGSS